MNQGFRVSNPQTNPQETNLWIAKYNNMFNRIHSLSNNIPALVAWLKNHIIGNGVAWTDFVNAVNNA